MYIYKYSNTSLTYSISFISDIEAIIFSISNYQNSQIPVNLRVSDLLVVNLRSFLGKRSYGLRVGKKRLGSYSAS